MSTPGYPGFGADPYAQGQNPQAPGPAGAPPVPGAPGGAQAHPGGDQGAPQSERRPRPGAYVPQSGDLFAGDGFERPHDAHAAHDRRPFAAYAQVPVDPYALAASAPLGTLDDPHAPRAASAQPARSAAPAGAPATAPYATPEPAVGTPYGGAAASGSGEQFAAPAQGPGPITFVPGITQDPPERPETGVAPGRPEYVEPSGIDGPGLHEPARTAHGFPAEPAPAAQEPTVREPDAQEPAGTAQSGGTAPAHPGAAEPESDDADDAADTIADPEATPAAELVWDDGTAQRLDGRVIVGRNPAPEEGATLAAVRDETLSLSKTHFEIDAADDGVWLTDRHSTNGVTIVRGDERIAAVPGERTELRPGDALEMGDRVATFRRRA